MMDAYFTLIAVNFQLFKNSQKECADSLEGCT